MHNDSSNLVHNSDSTITIPTLDNEVNKASFPLNKWGYSLDDITYNPIPTNTDTTLKTTNTYGNADTTTINLATKVDLTKPAGTYTNTFVFTATTNQSIFTITWNPGEGTVSPTTTEYLYGSKLNTLPTPTRAGYDFVGWFTQAEGGEEVTVETIVTEDKTYYAHWNEHIVTFDEAYYNAGKTKQGDYYTMQDMTTSICNNVTEPATITEDISTQLIDIRDNKLYWVSKLKDGNCWMTQNLDLDLTGGRLLSTTDSNVDEDIIITPSNWAYAKPNYKAGPEQYLPDGAETAVDITCTASTNGGKNCHYHLGDHYDWTAAIASNDSSEYASKTSSDYSKSPQYSICPKGFRLPNGAGNGHFKALNTIYGGVTNTDAVLLASPLYFVRSGSVDSKNSLNHIGENGYYWSSTIATSTVAYYLSFYSDKVVTNDSYYGRNSGYSVRCIAQ